MPVHSATASDFNFMLLILYKFFISNCMLHGLYNTLLHFNIIRFSGQVHCPVYHCTMCSFWDEVLLDTQPNAMLEEFVVHVGILYHIFLLAFWLRSAVFSYTSQFLLLLPQEEHLMLLFSTFILRTTYPSIICHAVHVIQHSLL
jgi:hypothetical protein